MNHIYTLHPAVKIVKAYNDLTLTNKHNTNLALHKVHGRELYVGVKSIAINYYSSILTYYYTNTDFVNKKIR